MRTTLVVSALTVVLLNSGCMGFGEKATVSATDNQYTPNAITIRQNEEVTWKNDGTARHTVTTHKVGDPLTASPDKDTEIASGASTSYKFEETGTFHVYCRFHSSGAVGQFNERMVMTVTVE